jgi:hypothetical protein
MQMKQLGLKTRSLLREVQRAGVKQQCCSIIGSFEDVDSILVMIVFVFRSPKHMSCLQQVVGLHGCSGRAP